LNRFYADDILNQIETLRNRVLSEFEPSCYRGVGGLHSRDLDILGRGHGRSLFDLDLERSLTSSFEKSFERALGNAKSIMNKIEKAAVEGPVDENSVVRLHYTVDNNGKVWEKTMVKEPGKEWKTEVNEYECGKPAVSEEQKTTLTSTSQEKKPLSTGQPQEPKPLETRQSKPQQEEPKPVVPQPQA